MLINSLVCNKSTIKESQAIKQTFYTDKYIHLFLIFVANLQIIIVSRKRETVIELKYL